MYQRPYVLQRMRLHGPRCGFTYDAYTNVNLASRSVTQMEDIKRQKIRLEALKKEAEEERQKAREAARARVLLDFERGQLGLAAKGPGATTTGVGPDSKERT